MGDVRYSSIGQLCDAGGASLQTGPFGSQLHASDYVEDGVPVVPTEALVDGRIDHDLLPMITTGKARELSRHELSAGDIVFARRGVKATGRTSQIGRAEEGFIGGTGVIRLRIHAERAPVTPDFMAWVLRSPDSVAWLKHNAIGATMPNLNEGIIRTVPVPLLPIREQHRIAGILGALDDKIELNRRLSETREGAAQALFRSWFPDSEADATYQDRSLADAVDLLRDQVDPQLEPDTFFQHYSLPAYDAGREPISEPGAGIRSSKFSVPRGSVLLSKLNPHIERVWWTDIGPEDRAICSTEFLVLQPRAGVGRAFVYEYLRSGPFRTMLTSLVTGTTGSHQRAQAEAILQIRMRLPGPAQAAKFEQVVGPMLDRVAVARRQSRALAELRDALMPRLLSGALPA